MTERPIAIQASPVAPIRLVNLWWVAAALAVMVAAIVSGDLWFLDFVHVFSGLLWTGIDLFMGFVVGPVLRMVDFETRRAVMGRLIPRTLFIMATLAIVTTNTGWFLAVESGFLELGFPELWWVIAALAITAILAVQGFGMLLPIELKAYFEMRKPAPDVQRFDRLFRFFFYIVASQGAMQVLIIVIMARFATGI
jgi:hypothetical protein